MKNSLKLALSLILLTSFCASAQNEKEGLTRLPYLISAVRNSKSPADQNELSKKIADLVAKTKSRNVSPGIITDLTALMDVKAARFWIADALGNLGRPASSAIPKLRIALVEEDCSVASLSAAGKIREAMRKIGVEPPAFRDDICHLTDTDLGALAKRH